MTDTATPVTGPVDAPASIESIVAEIEAGGDAPADALESVTQELVNEAEGTGDADEAPQAEDDATEAEDEAKEPEESNPDEQTYTVKVNGKEFEVPLSELKAGYSRTEDYKTKTTVVAEKGRALDAEKANLEANLKAQYASQLEESTNLFAQFDPVLAEANKIDWAALRQADPATFLQAQDAVQARLTAIQQMQQTVEKNRAEAQAHYQQQVLRERQDRFQRAAEKIISERPELVDDARFGAFATETIGHLRGEGFTDDELADSLDERVLKLGDDARRWRAHLAAQKSLPDKKVIPKSAVRPLTTDAGSRATPSRFPVNASRERKGDWIARQILSEE